MWLTLVTHLIRGRVGVWLTLVTHLIRGRVGARLALAQDQPLP